MKIELDLTPDDIRSLIYGLRLLKVEQRKALTAEDNSLVEIATTLGNLSLLEDRLMWHLR